MDALLFKPQLKVNQYDKDDARDYKRKENNLRCKQARGLSVKVKRKIPQTLEISNESIHDSKVIEKSKKVIPSRLEMLKEWKIKKEKQKAASKKPKAFVVKHVVHKDNNIYKDENRRRNQKENIIIVGKKIDSTKQPTKPKVLRERNVNVEINQTSQKQSLGWKKSQPSLTKKPPQKNRIIQTRSTSNVSKTLDNDKKVGRTENEPVTRILRGKKNVENKREKTKNFSEVGSKPSTQPNVSENIENNKTSSPKDLNDIEQKQAESIEVIDLPVEAIVDEPTTFEPPQGLAFINFKFDRDALSPRKFLDGQIQSEVSGEEKTLSPNTSEKANSVDGTPECVKVYPKVDSLRKSARLVRSKITSNGDLDTPKTPVALFKEREGITPARITSSKRNSLTPNPKNFLSKVEDPVAQRIESPKLQSKVDLLRTPPDMKKSVNHFTALVSSEEEKFSSCCEKWNKVMEENTAPEKDHGNILAAIGQAQLFMRKRFKQFKELIELHKDKTAEKAAHASDLDGFWEMIYFQVKDVHKRFAELEVLQNNNWEEPQDSCKAVKKVTKVKKNVVVKKPAPSKTSTRKSDFKKFREQMKAKNLKEQQGDAAGAFVSIITTSVDEEGKKVLTPMRRSLRNFNASDIKNSPAVSMVIPVDVSVKKSVDEFSADSLEETSPEKQKTKMKQKIDNPGEEIVKSLRRSTRKTPSKYRSVDAVTTQRPADVACNLFTDSGEVFNEPELNNEDENYDFNKYLSKTIISEDQPVKRDLLSSFDDRVDTPPPLPLNDLMMFSPIVTKLNNERSVPIQPSSSVQPTSSLVNDLLS
ncbi:disks large-associated protein 5-like isoform X2 [Hydractinia symbiolongicarpus]|uniref:disks large-associated protein 5-like isoform X2 n=1 Tax=Hydractinia symbiolongicarpus TaxID=13093 RepID=UPI00254E83BE|nr:disks large-associated protein 5-like isoform X2 [Hydractinia symbiolongicarpus]